jgi:hypothetical protein
LLAHLGEGKALFASSAALRVLERSQVVISQSEVRCADVPAPKCSGWSFSRAIVVVQANALNCGRTATIACVGPTNNV